MWDRKELKRNGKAAFKRNYWRSVLIALVLALLVGGTTAASSGGQFDELLQSADSLGSLTTILAGLVAGSLVAVLISILIDMFITNPLTVGGYRFFIRNSQGEQPSAGLLVSAYKEGRFGKIFGTMFLAGLYNALWTMLFIIPGIVKLYSYRMVPYILADNPDLSGNEVITMSREMMNGHKLRAFVLDLSFIGWDILACITLGLVGVFYVGPYQQATNAELYLALRK